MATPRANPTLEQVLEEVRLLRKKTTTERVIDGTVKLMVPVVLALTAWGVALEVRVSVLENEQATQHAWLKEALNDIKAKLQRLEEKVNAK